MIVTVYIQIELNIVQYSNANPDIVKNIEINNFAGSNNSVEIDTNGSGPFEYSLDGIIFQSNAIFKNITAGTYTVFVRDKTNCILSSAIINVLDYTRYFTPNADGINDVWKIKNLDLFPKAVVSIFDRYANYFMSLIR
ncbi:T9SS type B sorting domain-containing protein [Flavobacterium weaverense]